MSLFISFILTVKKLRLFLRLLNISSVKVLVHYKECFLAISQLEFNVFFAFFAKFDFKIKHLFKSKPMRSLSVIR